MLQEAGLKDALKNMWRNLKSVGNVSVKTVKGFGQAVRDDKVEGEYVDAINDIKKSIDTITGIVEKATGDKKQAKEFVKGLLMSYVEGGQLPQLGSAGGESGAGATGGDITAGSPVSGDPSAAAGSAAGSTAIGRMVTAMAANAAGVDPGSALNKAQQNDASFKDEYDKLILKVAEHSDEDRETVRKVIDWLFNNKKIIATTKTTIGESFLKRDDNLIFERWQKLANVNKVILESAAMDIMKAIKDGKITDVDVLNKVMDDPESGKALGIQAQVGEEKLTDAIRKKLLDAFEKKNPKAKEADGRDESGKPAVPAEQNQSGAAGDNSKLAALISKETGEKTKIIMPILDALINKCGVKLAK